MGLGAFVKGIVDFLKAQDKSFGPDKYCAKLEGSKAFMKKICLANDIPTAKFKICKNINDVNEFLKISKLPIVVKADGLAAGKGVSICKNKNQLFKNTSEIFKGKFGSSNKVVLEEFLPGEEASYFLIVDKKSFKFFGNAQDHKRVYEKDLGANTGGMGAYSPAPIIDKSLEKKIILKIVKPTLNALKRKKKFYIGFLYVGLMIQNEPYLIEYNIRMVTQNAKPSYQAKTDLVEIIKTTENKLNKVKIKWKNKMYDGCFSSKGYPSNIKDD